MNKRRTIFVGAILLIVTFLIALFPLNAFKHGFYYDEPEIDYKVELETVDVSKTILKQKFVPNKDGISGVQIMLSGYEEGMDGKIHVSVLNVDDNVLCSDSIDVSKLDSDGWAAVYFNKKLSKGREYIIQIIGEIKNTSLPKVVCVGLDCIQKPNENIQGVFTEGFNQYTLLATYAYSKQTFEIYEKILILLFCISLLFVLIWWYKEIHHFYKLALFIALTSLLSWGYMNNTMNNKNESFDGFQKDSEMLVEASIYAAENDIETDIYGLGAIYTLTGELSHEYVSELDFEFLTDAYHDRGYNIGESVVAFDSNDYTDEYILQGNLIEFQNGDRYEIKAIKKEGDTTYAYLDAKGPLAHSINGSLCKSRIICSDNNYAPLGKWKHYISQYGLQGKIMRRIAQYFKCSDLSLIFEFLCSLFTAAVLVTIVMLIYKKYDYLFSVVFFVTIWLSPWVTNFARNLYWVEFTWFVPMLIGLFISLDVNNPNRRVMGYISGGISILIKSLCGYEYISTIMLGLIAFLLVDMLMSIAEKNYVQFRLLFRTIFILGMCAIIGFSVAIIIHGYIRGDGNLILGIKCIWKDDVLRRTSGGHISDFSVSYWPSLNASKWEVICNYFKFDTEIITGIPGNLFPIISIIPLILWVYDLYAGRMIKYEFIFMYFIMFITSVSWFYLGKSHSYIHRHMNYVLWYFGFIQTCFYIIVNRIVRQFGLERTERARK